MSFFGLTMLGPQDPWMVNSRFPPPPPPLHCSLLLTMPIAPIPLSRRMQVPKFPDVSSVAKDDFLSAFRRVAGGEGSIVLSQVGENQRHSCSLMFSHLLLISSYGSTKINCGAQVKEVLKFALDSGVDPLQASQANP